jgi:hypothetical protein
MMGVFSKHWDKQTVPALYAAALIVSKLLELSFSLTDFSTGHDAGGLIIRASEQPRTKLSLGRQIGQGISQLPASPAHGPWRPAS